MALSKEITENECAKAAKDGEPVFILLGHDPDAPKAIRAWTEARFKRKPVMSDKIKSALALANAMERYQDENQ